MSYAAFRLGFFGVTVFESVVLPHSEKHRKRFGEGQKRANKALELQQYEESNRLRLKNCKSNSKLEGRDVEELGICLALKWKK